MKVTFTGMKNQVKERCVPNSVSTRVHSRMERCREGDNLLGMIRKFTEEDSKETKCMVMES